ncbi:hypothetical protein BH10PSE6_BH10PSE6_24900 [soil metagenome]
MRIMPNQTILEGRATAVTPAADGWGAHVEFAVEKSAAAEGSPDFVQAQPGTVLKVFSADSKALQLGKDYVVVATVLGGPQGERVVVQSARAKE